jgi:hypothetical protein
MLRHLCAALEACVGVAHLNAAAGCASAAARGRRRARRRCQRPARALGEARCFVPPAPNLKDKPGSQLQSDKTYRGGGGGVVGAARRRG